MSKSPRVVDDDVQLLAQTARSLVWALRRFGEREAGLASIPNSEIEVLRTVAERPGSTVSEVARFLGLQSSNVSTTVRSLVDRGLLERRADPGDRRSHRLHRTALAERDNRMIDEMWVRGVRSLLDGMSPADAAKLAEAIPLLARLGTMPDS
ncbi:MarR family winged helix-turn-helix transcriptional regulator [Rhodococcus opacus]|uniref:MarR family winged helix-turn-helix transcriptional regulator n=1 Tax=Rhodococcus opacus TaxID=37919 RepID=UPI00046CD27A|nr:MarR family transcriptional regulator [Rhodococcus opacus]UDH01352.1 MarR family transcriptional regulator [Rhodococcus opacus PD630]